MLDGVKRRGGLRDVVLEHGVEGSAARAHRLTRREAGHVRFVQP